MHKICFLESTEIMLSKGPLYAQTQSQKDEDPMLKILITTLTVTDRPDLINYSRKGSVKKSVTQQALTKLKLQADSEMVSKAREKGDNPFDIAGSAALHHVQAVEDEDIFGRRSVDGGESADEEDDMVVDPTQLALPTLMMAGTVWGEIFRADLSKNRVDVDTNNLRKQSLLVCWDLKIQ